MTLVLDANVLENMLNPAKNQKGFITEMIARILREQWTIGLDERLQIDKEYFKRLGAWISKAEDSVARQLLGWFINASATVLYPHVARQQVDKSDALMRCIERQMPDKGGSGKEKKSLDKDRVYVYITARLGGTLITDDHEDILSVAVELKKCAKTHARNEMEIMDTYSANAWLATQPAPNPTI
jgi:hypothetical protein